jgi:ABC-type lipoprotein release transport system permease subunit
MRQIYLVLTYSGRIMVPRDRGQFGNIITMILLALIVCSAVVLAVYLFLSPTLH